MRHSSHFHAIRIASRPHLQRTSQPQHRSYVRRAPYPASLPTRRAAAGEQLRVHIARTMLELFRTERQQNGALSTTYQTTIRRLLDTLFPDMAQHDPQWQARIDAALNDGGDGTC